MEQTFEQVLEREGKLLYTNVGVSMLPLLREGKDVMIIFPKPEEGYRRYDAVLFRRPGVKGRGAYVMHRILKVLPDGKYWIVGDNTLGGEIVAEENILGILTGVIRDGKPVDFNGFGYRLYLALWIKPYRFRIAVMKTKRFGFRCLYAVWRRVKPFVKRKQKEE